VHQLLGDLVQLPAGVSQQQQQQQQQQQDSGTRVVDRQVTLQAQSEPVTSSTWDHASQGNPAAVDKQAQEAQQAQQAQREAPQNVGAWLDGAPAQPRAAEHLAAVADADGKSQVSIRFCQMLKTVLATPVEHRKTV
jgi:type V secretory pathway adhesin AidA